MEKLNYRHLSSRERIAYLRAKGKSLSDIAESIGRNKSSISRELKRNQSPIYNVYLANIGGDRSHAATFFTPLFLKFLHRDAFLDKTIQNHPLCKRGHYVIILMIIIETASGGFLLSCLLTFRAFGNFKLNLFAFAQRSETRF